MNFEQKQAAYEAIKNRYDLKAHQRDVLDREVDLDQILELAHVRHWFKVTAVLKDRRIIRHENY